MGSDISSTSEYGIALPTLERKMVYVKTPATADNADTIVMTLAEYGIDTFLGSLTFIHSTDLDIVTLETTDACTTSVTSGVLTLTIGGSTANKRRFVVIFGE